MSSQTWIVFKANSMSAQGWESRKLMPSGSGTNILSENWDYSGRVPTVGERVREYSQDSGNSQVTHGRESDWIVTHLEHFSSFDTDQRIVVCYCDYQPVEADWEPLQRGLPVDEMMQQVSA